MIKAQENDEGLTSRDSRQEYEFRWVTIEKKISDDSGNSGNGVLIMRWQSRRDEMIVDSNYIV